jgi:hypothetical protein
MEHDLSFRCECQRLLEVPANLAGLRVRCPACRRIVFAPAAEVVPVAHVVQPPAPAPSRLTRPTLRDTAPPATPLSVAANVIAVSGFVIFGASIALVFLAPGRCPGWAPLVLFSAAASLVVARAAGPRFRAPVAALLALGALCVIPLIVPRDPAPLTRLLRPGPAPPCAAVLDRLERTLAGQSVRQDTSLLQLARDVQNFEPCPCAAQWQVERSGSFVVTCPRHPGDRAVIRASIRGTR